MPRNMQRDTEDTAAFLVNAIAEELERILRSVRHQELQLTAAIEEFSQAFTRVASGDFSVQVKRDFSGDSKDVLAFLVNQTVLELGSLVNETQRQSDEERDHLEHLIQERTTELRLLATKDPLTGLLNRRHFFQLAEEECARCHRYERPIAAAMLDLDHFKKINDNHGHAIGDEALRLTAAAIRKELRQQDLICRYGGEEFVVLMPETDAQRGYEVQERIRAGITQIGLRDGDQGVPLRVSIGVTQWHPPESIEQAIARADANMYQAKAAGRNRVIMTP
jgi:diguanylate cyclase (GGDEF)-like protein